MLMQSEMDPNIYRQTAVNVEGMYDGGPYDNRLGDYIKSALSSPSGEYLTPAAQQFYETYMGRPGAEMNKIIGRIIRCFRSFVYAESAFGYMEYIAASQSKQSFNKDTTGMLEFTDPADAYMMSKWLDDTTGNPGVGRVIVHNQFVNGELLAKLVYQSIGDRRCSFYDGRLLANYLQGNGNSWGMNRREWSSSSSAGRHPFVAAVGGGASHKSAGLSHDGNTSTDKKDSSTTSSSGAGQEKPTSQTDAGWVRPGLKKMYTYKTSPDVQDIQHILNVAAHGKLQEDGAFGPMTIDAVYGKLSKDKPSADRQLNDAISSGTGGFLTITDAKK